MLRKLLLRLAEVLPGGGHDRNGHAETRSDLDGEASAWRSVHDPVVRRKRARIEPERGDRHAVGRGRVRFQRVVMGCGDQVHTTLSKVVDHCDPKRAPFNRVGAGADFVKQHQRGKREIPVH